jgi:hypothetical protein
MRSMVEGWVRTVRPVRTHPSVTARSRAAPPPHPSDGEEA